MSQLKSIVERIERLHEDKRAIEEDIKAVYAEAAGNGFDKKALREVVKLRARDPEELQEHESILLLYLSELGMFGGTGIAHARDTREAVRP